MPASSEGPRPGEPVVLDARQGREPIANDRGSIVHLTPPDSAIDVHVIELVEGGPRGRFHYHSNAENMIYVLEGAIRVLLDTGELTLEANQFAMMPRGLRHGVEVLGGPARLLEIYSPGNADFITVSADPQQT